jgi:hypothetical protein
MAAALLLIIGSAAYEFSLHSGTSKNAKQESRKDSVSKENASGKIGEGASPSSSLAVPEGGFSFVVQADSHLDENTNTSLYRQTIMNITDGKPSFLMDLGDTFMSEKFAKTLQEVEGRYIQAKSYFDLLGNIPLYLVNGNHDGECGWMGNMEEWARNSRLKYFPSDDIGSGAYLGNRTTANYYSFVKGDAQFIILDPFTFTTEKAKGEDDGWSYTLGKTQYDWLKATLENSNSKYKFVFIHNLVGGYGKDARGGAEAAKYYEWGGYSLSGSYDFDEMRPGWGKPIHQLLVDNNVNVVFHGHDHFYARQSLDGIIYQLVPQPGTPGNSVNDASKYSYKAGVFLPSAGYLRVVVSSEEAVVEYVKTAQDMSQNSSIPDHYVINPK